MAPGVVMPRWRDSGPGAPDSRVPKAQRRARKHRNTRARSLRSVASAEDLARLRAELAAGDPGDGRGAE